MKKMFEKFNKRINSSIFQKLILSFVALVTVPLTISFYVAQKTANDLVVAQISSETMNSLELVSNSLNTMLQKMYSLALYVNDDENISELLAQEADDAINKNSLTPSSLALRKLERINKFNSIISNLSFNMMDVRSYITIVTPNGQKYTNWSYEGNLSKAYTERAANATSGEIWLELESNYSRDANQFPYVITLGKNIVRPSNRVARGTFLISVTEQSFRDMLSAGDTHQIRMILDEDLRIITSTKENSLGYNFSELYDTVFPSGEKGSFECSEKDGQRVIVTYNLLRDWRVVDVKSYNSVTSQMRRTRNRLLLLNSMFMFIFILVAAIIARGISKPVQRLTSMMLDDGSGKIPAQPLLRTRDEISILEESFYIMRENNRALISKNIDVERKKRDAELKALQAQISPHFLFNTLNAIRWAAINNHNKKAADMVLALSNLLRMTIVKNEEFITVADELENLQHYAELFQMRYSMTFDLVFTVPDGLLCYKIPKLLLQPLVENSIIHGFEGMPDGGRIEIGGEITVVGVRLTVYDNGVGIQEKVSLNQENTKEMKFSGIGISNVDERLKLYFGEQYGLTLDNGVEGGTMAVVTLPPLDERDGEQLV